MNIVSLKQSLHMAFRSKLHIFACVASLFLLCSTVPMQADINNCNCVGDSLANVTICIGGTNYVVKIYGCNIISTTPPYLAEVCAGSGRQDQYTMITRVCFVGVRPIPIDPQATFSALLCKLDPCKSPGILGASLPGIINSVYCWTMSFPKCVGVDNTTGCIEKCGDGCCRIARRWTRNLLGQCVPDGTWNCDINPTTCVSPCYQIDCPNLDDCCE